MPFLGYPGLVNTKRVFFSLLIGLDWDFKCLVNTDVVRSTTGIDNDNNNNNLDVSNNENIDNNTIVVETHRKVMEEGEVEEEMIIDYGE